MSSLKKMLALLLLSSSAFAYVPSQTTNTPWTDALRDGSGNFSAGTITAALNGNANSCTNISTNGTSGYVWTMTSGSTQGWAAGSGGGLSAQANNTLFGNVSGASAVPSSMTPAQANLILPIFTSTLNGSCPLSGGGTANFLRADGTWAAPGGGITALTGGVTASGTGSVVATVVTDANLTGPITSVGNATSVAAQTGTGSTFMMQASPTVTGALTLPNGTVAAPALVSGKATNDGMSFPSSGHIDLDIGGVKAVEVSANALAIGSASTDAAGFAIADYSGNYDLLDGGVQYMTYNNGNAFLTFGYNSVGNKYNYLFSHTSAETNPALQAAGSTAHAPPTVTVMNTNATVGTYEGMTTAGQSYAPNGGYYCYNDVQTAASETAHCEIWNANAGAFAKKWSISKTGQVQNAGTAPTISSCGTGPSVATGSDNAFKVTVGTGMLTGCVVTAATAWPNGGHCSCTDQTSSAAIVLEAVLSSTATITITPYTRSTGVAGSFTAADAVSCACNYF